MSTRLFAVVGAAVMGLVLVPAANAVASATAPAQREAYTVMAWQKGHVNSTGSTRLFVAPTGDSYYGWLSPCTNFYYDSVINGRYHTDLGGYVSTDKAGPGWCGD